MIDTDLRHVDVAILYGLGQQNRAQYIAKRLYRKDKLAAQRIEQSFFESTTNTDISLSHSNTWQEAHE